MDNCEENFSLFSKLQPISQTKEHLSPLSLSKKQHDAAIQKTNLNLKLTPNTKAVADLKESMMKTTPLQQIFYGQAKADSGDEESEGFSLMANL